MTYHELDLPTNPFQLQPIRESETDRLAGRAAQIKQLKYYLNLTANGQSPHLAIIGERGVGKTSLLNVASSFAKEERLLVIRIDLNEKKAESTVAFWHDFYVALIDSMVQAGCWGGKSGIIYESLMKMIFSNAPKDLDAVVLKVPYAFACNTGIAAHFPFPDSLLKNDFQTCIAELQLNGLQGIAILIDEADCLAANEPLLQVFRNLFQSLDRCSLIIAGTNKVFPALSSIFSPIPRQFHKINVAGFQHPLETADLITNSLPKTHRGLAPKQNEIRQLHELCSGDPSEIQLYCHHMYRLIEEGYAKQMSFSPRVFREVLKQYRANTTETVQNVLNAIERLPNQLLYESPWLRLRKLSISQNIHAECLRRSLMENRCLEEKEKDEIGATIKCGYQRLFKEGIINSPDRLFLIGDPHTGGFWKSFVEVERKKRWAWNRHDYYEELSAQIAFHIAKCVNSPVHTCTAFEDDGRNSLEMLRKNEVIPASGEGVFFLSTVSQIGKERSCKRVISMIIRFQVDGSTHSSHWHFMIKFENEITFTALQDVLQQKQAIFESCGIVIAISDWDTWELPTNDELHRMAWISDFRLASHFGARLYERALDAFRENRLADACTIFESMINDRFDSDAANNLAFCQMILGKVADANKILDKVTAKGFNPLHQYNKGIAKILSGSRDLGISILNETIDWLDKHQRIFNQDYILCIIWIKNSLQEVEAIVDCPLEMAILGSLFHVEALSKGELLTQLTKRFDNPGFAILRNPDDGIPIYVRKQ